MYTINNCIHSGTAVGVIMLGAANSGKGTQAKLIIDNYQGYHISTGDLVRAKIESDQDFKDGYVKDIKSGCLISDEVVLGLTRDHLALSKPSGIVVLDGWCRTKHQTDMLDKLFVKPEHLIAFDFDVCLSVARERARIRAREDDTEINKRFRLWQEHRASVVHKLRAKGVYVITIDARQDPAHIHNSVRNGIVDHIKAIKGRSGKAPGHRALHHH